MFCHAVVSSGVSGLWPIRKNVGGVDSIFINRLLLYIEIANFIEFCG